MEILICLLVLLVIILYIRGLDKLFKKIEEPVWKIFSPFHVNSVLCDKANINSTSFFVIFMVIVDILTICGVIGVFSSLSAVLFFVAIGIASFGMLFMSEEFMNEVEVFSDLLKNSLVFLRICLIINYLFKIYIFYNLFLKFGKNKKAAFLYSLFWPLGVFFVGRDNSKYSNDCLENMIK